MPRQTTAEATVAALLRHGIDTLYALPGVHNDFLFDAVAQSGGRMRALHPRHEQTAAYMALGAALATGRPQVCAAVPGPGLLNMSAALLTAYGTNAPVLALAGQIPSDAIDRGWGHLHELPDQLGLMAHFTKHAARITGAADAPAWSPRRSANPCPSVPAPSPSNAPSTSGASQASPPTLPRSHPTAPSSTTPPSKRPRSSSPPPNARSSSPAVAPSMPRPNSSPSPSASRPPS